MKIMSLGDQLARLLSNNDTRQMLHYRANRPNISSQLPDYFDGEEYKALKARHFFQSPDDIVFALFLDDEYLIQLAIIPGKPVDLDSFLIPIIDEIISLGKHGLIINKLDGEKIVSKVHIVMASGDIPQVAKVCHHKGHNSTYGCRVCSVKGESPNNGRSLYFQDCLAPLRPKSDFVDSNPDTNIDTPNIFARLPTFNGSSFYGLDEMHLIGHEIGKLIHKLLVLSNTTPSVNNYYYKNDDGSLSKDRYTFLIPKKDVLLAGTCIESSRSKIPVSFQGSWDNLILKTDGARAIDYIDFLLYVVPILLVPLLPKLALLALVKGCSIALQWDLNEDLLVEMENSFAAWHQFLQSEINKKNVSLSVFSPVNHYLTHIPYIIRKVGNLRVYSTRSIERTIGRYSKLIKSKVFSGANAGNLVERLAIRGYLNCALSVEQLLDLILPSRNSLDDYTELPYLSPYNKKYQLWNPFEQSNYIPQFISMETFIEKLNVYYTRSKCSLSIPLNRTLDTIKVAARAWIDCHVYRSEMYRKKRPEFCRGNQYIKLHVTYRNSPRWYVGSVVFYFSHNYMLDDEKCRQFLVLVDVMKEHSAIDYNKTIPLVTMDEDSASQRFVVISLNDVQDQVGLVQSAEYPNEYKVIAPYSIFNEDMKRTAGKSDYIKLR
ncbi:MAG: hypothetical protein EXX96DRAFT_507889 [Benjaminiella poitrasii]|nr:MAG: hypothetical protein EXX96DRAFT_507889 [Benjaminiella poitrasii]